MKGLVVRGLVVVALACGVARAQEVAAPSAASVDGSTPIDPAARQVLQALADRERGLADAMAVLQKERDAVTAEWTRTVARLRTEAPAGMELAPQLTHYIKRSK